MSIIIGDVLDPATWAQIPDASVQCVVTSPPYWALRSYLPADHPDKSRELGSEKLHDCAGWATGSPCGECYVCHQVQVFRFVREKMRDDGILWVNLGDSYAMSSMRGKNSAFNGIIDQSQSGIVQCEKHVPPGLNPKDLCMIPFRFALAMQADGWWLRSVIPWIKRSSMPDSATDRPGTATEYVFMFTKAARYFSDMEAAKVRSAEPDRERKMERIGGATGAEERHGEQGIVDGRCAGRNFRNADLMFQSLDGPHGLVFANFTPAVLDVTARGYAGAHFATFPLTLIEPLVRFSTSEKGKCPECGKPWERVVEREDTPKYTEEGKPQGIERSKMKWNDSHPSKNAARWMPTKNTIGWQPGCDCREEIDTGGQNPDGSWINDYAIPEPTPCTIMDPYMGSGTVAVLAESLGLDWAGCELNAEYAAQAENRIGKARMPNTYSVADTPDDCPLFEEATNE